MTYDKTDPWLGSRRVKNFNIAVKIANIDTYLNENFPTGKQPPLNSRTTILPKLFNAEKLFSRSNGWTGGETIKPTACWLLY